MRRLFGVGDTALDYSFPQTNGITQIRAKNHDTGGSNGGGKSTILEAVFFALTGRTLRHSRRMEDYLHDLSDGDGEVELEYDNIRIVRRIQPAGKKPGIELWVDGVNKTINSSKVETKKLIDQHVGINFETLSNIIVFGQHNLFSFLDAAEGDKREIVENLMNLKEYNVYEERARETYKTTKTALKSLADRHDILTDQTTVQTLLLDEQKTALESHRKKTQVEIDAIDKKIESLPDTLVLRAQWGQFDAAEQKRRDVESQLSTLKESLTNVSTRLNEIGQAKLLATAEKQPILDRVTVIKAKFGRLDEMRAEQLKETVDYEQTKHDIDRQIKQVELGADDAIRAIQPERDWKSFMGNVMDVFTEANRQLDAAKSHKLTNDDVCPTCYGKIDIHNVEGVIRKWEFEVKTQKDAHESVKRSMQTDLERVETERAAVKIKLTETIQSLLGKKRQTDELLKAQIGHIDAHYKLAKTRLDALLSEAQSELATFDQQINDRFNKLTEKANSDRARLQTEEKTARSELASVANARRPQIGLEQIGVITQQRQQMTVDRDTKATSLAMNPYAEIITKLEKIIADLKDKTTAMETEIKDSEDKLPYYEFWAEAYGKEGIKSFIIDKIIPTLNGQIEYWLQTLYQGAIKVAFDKFLEVKMVNSASGNEMMFGLGSGGEQKRVDMAIMLAFRDIMKMSSGKNPNVLFFDEVAESLDEPGVHHLFETIKLTAQESRVFVITHHPVLNGLLDEHERLTFQKKNGAITLVA
jgi:DNA repair exonuclease SbcCD ATPase subunit